MIPDQADYKCRPLYIEKKIKKKKKRTIVEYALKESNLPIGPMETIRTLKGTMVY